MGVKTQGMLFKAEMVRALLNTKADCWPAEPVDESLPFKCQTRRVIDPQPTPDFGQTIKLATYHQEKVNKRTGELYPGAEVFAEAQKDEGHNDDPDPETESLKNTMTLSIIIPSYDTHTLLIPHDH